MKTPVLIVVIASVVVLCTLPAIYIFLAYHTHKERKRWKRDYDKAVKRIEAEAQNNPRPASAATHSSIYSSAAPGRAPPAQQSYYRPRHQQPQAPARPAPVHNPRAAPPRPPRELNVSRSSRNYLPQADAAPGSEGVGRSVARPAPGSRTTTRSGGIEWGISSGSERRKQEQVFSGGMAPSREKPHAVAAVEGEARTENHHGDNRVARQLLKPRRRAQIEVWLDETVSLWEAQYCSAGRLFGHRSDLFTPQATGQPTESPRLPPVDDHICPVCGRSSEGEGPPAHPPGKDPPVPPIEGKPGRGKYMLRGIRAAMGQFRAKDGGKSGKDDKVGLGRMPSTAMFLAEVSEDDSSIATALSSSGPFGGEDGKAPPDERKALEERMGRLMRAQKLLDRSQARH